ncbi:MAG: hypothetical protein HY026_05760 [Deltaproteobacteria bacterium]|nr:hypothetical protein [Deltaproteobacteria bacterium]
MRERERELRRRRHRKEKAHKARVRALMAQAQTKVKPAKKPAETLREEKRIIQKPTTKVVRPARGAKKTAEVKKGGNPS